MGPLVRCLFVQMVGHGLKESSYVLKSKSETLDIGGVDNGG